MNILLIDAFPEKMIRELQAIPGAEVKYEPDWERAQILAAMPEVQVLIMNSNIRADREFADQSPKLKLICRAGVGLDHIDVALLESRGVQVFSTPGANADSVAEQTIAMMLALMHKVVPSNTQVKHFEWRREENRGTEAMDKTIGILGYGNCGSRVGEKLRGFKSRILAYDKYKTGYAPDWVKETTLEDIFENADVLTLHIPLSDETKGWVNEAFFDKFKKNIYFLNLARGPIVFLDGLLAALTKGKVKGAALDVLENENFSKLLKEERARLEKLFALDNVIFTPHIGGWTFESLERINGRIVEEVKRVIETQNGKK